MFGEKNPLWRRYKTQPLKKWLRKNAAYLNWQKLVFKRDAFTCQICGTRRGKLEIDHFPKSFNKICNENNIVNYKDVYKVSKFWDIDNGRVLCISCHKLTPNYGRKELHYSKFS